LTGGMVQDEKQRSEYLQTLNNEADRLNRLIGNVLDFSRLEKQRPQLQKCEIRVADLLDQAQQTWQGRCKDAEKELVLDNQLDAGQVITTDVQLVQQILGNLIDNSCKYSRGADDQRIWLRAFKAGDRTMAFEVEDRGPGIPPGERHLVFQAFRRGNSADVTAG